MRFHGMRSREDLFPGTDKVELFLSDLADNRQVAASTQNQVLNAPLWENTLQTNPAWRPKSSILAPCSSNHAPDPPADLPIASPLLRRSTLL